MALGDGPTGRLKVIVSMEEWGFLDGKTVVVQCSGAIAPLKKKSNIIGECNSEFALLGNKFFITVDDPDNVSKPETFPIEVTLSQDKVTEVGIVYYNDGRILTA